MTRRCTAALYIGLAGCAASAPAPPNDAAQPAPSAAADEPVNRRTRALDLIVPEATDDLSSLDDAALDAALAAADRRVNKLTADAFRFAADYTGNDLTADAGYRKLLLEMKTAETEFGRLEMERERRRRERK